MAAAWMALLTYTASQVAVFAYLGLTLGNWVDGHGGPGSPRVGWLTIGFYALMAAFPLLGLVQAAWLKRARPMAYQKVIGTISE
ncbi:hypothetical protein [Streptomyces plumbiresistens]|uniref:MFS transporter n=1 Tax=Streptomyces plumbiresistens TaxID=511811 RepID=A0ABP7SLR1_9ACTN